jgi:hypothetical protein
MRLYNFSLEPTHHRLYCSLARTRKLRLWERPSGDAGRDNGLKRAMPRFVIQPVGAAGGGGGELCPSGGGRPMYLPSSVMTLIM